MHPLKELAYTTGEAELARLAVGPANRSLEDIQWQSAGDVDGGHVPES